VIKANWCLSFAVPLYVVQIPGTDDMILMGEKILVLAQNKAK
jgi:hypothetical protein